ncbi:hypothetical protein PNOK_0958100 [Pyrrhoderma noxium]|uniref:DUF7918 domain-containing protein n=1 Tax=Pyrrhoderma noxium TaxID=2282107 RepID=A0A286U620_9AGAM|nr:hypothetical protein PNOK_0958100 [Pyrrhoderma noxium]
MPHFANCTIGIKIDGEVLEEYATQVNDSHVTSWIASESNKEFEIFFHADHYPSSLQLIIYVDGVELVNRGYDHRKMGKEIACYGVSIDASTVKPFVFSDINFSEDEPVYDPDRIGNVGTIKIEVLQVIFTESRDPTYIVPGMSNDPLHKRSKILGARGVWLGEQKRVTTKKMTSTPFDPEHPGPVVTFNYVYRPRSILLTQGIIPTYVPKYVEEQEEEPEPEPLINESREELIRRLREQQEQVARELKELEDIRRLRERQAEIQRELDELVNFGFDNV